jgi:hypothetical protein
MTDIYKHYLFSIRLAAILPLYESGYDNLNVNELGTQVGFVFITNHDWKEMYGEEKESSEWRNTYHPGKTKKEIAESILKSSVETFSQYLSNETYGFKITGKVLDDESRWGYYGNDHEESGLIQDAKGEIDYHLNYLKVKKLKRLKKLIKSKVPLQHRNLEHYE